MGSPLSTVTRLFKPYLPIKFNLFPASKVEPHCWDSGILDDTDVDGFCYNVKFFENK